MPVIKVVLTLPLCRMRITKVKSRNIEHDLCQNLVQTQSACQSNKKRKHKNLEYVYRIVTIDEKWGFIVVTSNDNIGQ